MHRTTLILLPALLAVALIQTAHTQTRAPNDQSWNRRVAGAGDYQVVLEVSGRGEMNEAIKHFEAAHKALTKGLLDHPEYSDDLVYLDEILGISYLRKGELDNCVHLHNAETCIFPLSKQGEHKLTAGSSEAVGYFKRHLSRKPENLEVRWLLNLAYMTLGQYPRGLSPSLL